MLRLIGVHLEGLVMHVCESDRNRDQKKYP
uniref:Uncharacterized protein n=1 Tax=Anguilla anguilla TaxID=7936 RepID=A0A0E9PCU0_ANGAN